MKSETGMRIQSCQRGIAAWPLLLAGGIAAAAITAGVWWWATHMRPVEVAYPEPESPHSVRIERYRRASDAERAATRLRADLGEPAFVVQLDDPKRGTWYETHLGPWSTTTAATEAKTRAENKGLATARVRKLEDYQAELAAAAMATAVTTRRPLDAARIDPEFGPRLVPPASLPSTVGTLLDEVPVQTDLYVVGLGLHGPRPDRRAHRDARPDPVEDFYFPRFLDQAWLDQHAQSAVALKLEDKLYHTRFSLLIAEPVSNSTATAMADEMVAAGKRGYQSAGYAVSEATVELDIGGRTLEGRELVARRAGRTTITLQTWPDERRNRVWYARSLHESGAEVRGVLAGAEQGRGAGAYGEVVRTLYTLPTDAGRFRVLGFRLEQVGEDYVEEKGGADWARAMQGHWSAVAVFVDRQVGQVLMLQLFDLRTPTAAKRVHSMFGRSKRELIRELDDNPYLGALLEPLRPARVEIDGRTGWLVTLGSDLDRRELSIAWSRWVLALLGERRHDRELGPTLRALQLAGAEAPVGADE